MKLLIASIHSARTHSPEHERLASLYFERIPQYTPIEVKVFQSEEAFFSANEKLKARTAPVLVLLDVRGELFSSEQFAAWIGRQRDSGIQNLTLAIGPADGWSSAARSRADRLLSFGPMTLAHEIARVVLAEQVYRALTILAGHPYHRQ